MRRERPAMVSWPSRATARRIAVAAAVVAAGIATAAAVIATAVPDTAGSKIAADSRLALPSQAASAPRAAEPEIDVGTPVVLSIPRIGVDAPVVPVGVTPAGHMDTPKGGEKTGWFAHGPEPGEEGSAVIAGHSGLRSGPAVFDELVRIEPGDRLYVVDDEGTTIEFRVRETRTCDWDAKPPDVFTSDEGRHLNLITCTGSWDAAAGTHGERLIVFSDVVGP
jgi:LPXTG-site transpeptidase (sortase) family protein